MPKPPPKTKLPRIPDEHVALLHAAIGMTTTNCRRDIAWWLNGDNHANCHYADSGKPSYGMVKALVDIGLLYPAIEYGTTIIHKVTDYGIRIAKAQTPKSRKSYRKTKGRV